MISHINNRIDSLALDHKRGASEIVEDAASLMIDIAEIGLKEPVDAERLLKRAVKRLVSGQPSMAPVLNLANKVCLAWQASDDNWETLIADLNALRDFRRFLKDHILQKIEQLPRVENCLMTFSNSSTVIRCIIACHERFGFPKKVICGEGRPVMEGVALARKLHISGISVTLYTDAALMSRVDEVDAVWVGGDCFSFQGLVNKVGSRALAMLGKIMDIPFISLMGSDKLLSPELLKYFQMLQQNPREIGADETEGLDVVNEYYERIPYDLVSYVFTDHGLSTTDDALSLIKHEPISPLFHEIVD